MSPSLQSLRITPLERALWFVDGLWKFSPCPKGHSAGRPRKESSTYGQMRLIAIAYADGKFGTQTIAEVATEHGYADSSLRTSVSRIRRGRGTQEKRTYQRRRAA